MTTVYTTVNGQILHEKRDGVEAYYRPDTLGNVIATTSTTGTVRSTHTYWPYGEVRASTGTNHSPFKYVGTLGYYADSATTLYVRARYYRPAQTRWMTVDPLWPSEMAYGYANSMPSLMVDPDGTWCVEGRRKLLRWSSIYWKVCYGFMMLPLPPVAVGPICIDLGNPAVPFPCTYGEIRIFIAAGDKEAINAGSVVTLIGCSRLTHPALVLACELLLAALHVWLALCSKRNGDSCMTIRWNHCTFDPKQRGLGCCDGYQPFRTA